MDNDLLNKYKNEMLKMYQSANATTQEPKPIPSTTPLPQNTAEGKLLAVITTLRELYPVKDAKVTVFTGDYNNMSVVDTALTDESGRTKLFVLPTPEKALSLNQDNIVLPYATYNMLVEADGYIKNIHLNIPVFGTVTSIQQSNLLLEETAGEDKGPQIFDESTQYGL